MLEQPELTVIMPVYNMEKYLARALDHLADQTDPNFKLLIVNDGSKDKTREIAEGYRDKFKYFRIINKPNGGLFDARNVGMENVDTPYFTFHDGDDWVEPDYTAYFVRAFHEHPEAAMVCCGFYIDYEHGDKSIPAAKFKPAKMLTKVQTYREIVNFLGSMFFNHAFTSSVKGYTWNKGYKSTIVKKHGMEFVKKLAFMEDQIFNVKYIAISDGFYRDTQPLYHYWQRDDSMVHNFNLKMVPDNFKANWFVWKIIIKSLIAERRKEKSESKQIYSASEGSSNDRKG